MEQMNLPFPRAIVVLSGGQDSTTCLYWTLSKTDFVHCITFNYNQRHSEELKAAHQVVAAARRHYPTAKIEHEVVTLGPVLQGTSPLVSNADLEQYENHQSLPGGLEKTFVPLRNQLFLTIAMNRAYVLDCNSVVTGVCEEDYGGYPDCRRVFIEALEKASNLGTVGEEGMNKRCPAILTPLMRLTKKETVELAMGLDGCYQALAFTHTAYDGKFPPTGRDHATLLRAKGFEEAGIPDPLVLRAWSEKLMELPLTANYTRDLGKYLALLGL